MHSSVNALQILADLSSEVGTEAPSVENTTENTYPECPARVRVHSPVAALQILAVALPECPARVRVRSPVAALQILAVASSEAVRTEVPSSHQQPPMDVAS